MGLREDEGVLEGGSSLYWGDLEGRRSPGGVPGRGMVTSLGVQREALEAQ